MNKYDNNLGNNMNLKVINTSPTDKISHLFTLMVLKRTYSKQLFK